MDDKEGQFMIWGFQLIKILFELELLEIKNDLVVDESDFNSTRKYTSLSRLIPGSVFKDILKNINLAFSAFLVIVAITYDITFYI